MRWMKGDWDMTILDLSQEEQIILLAIRSNEEAVKEPSEMLDDKDS